MGQRYGGVSIMASLRTEMSKYVHLHIQLKKLNIPYIYILIHVFNQCRNFPSKQEHVMTIFIKVVLFVLFDYKHEYHIFFYCMIQILKVVFLFK